MLDGDLVLVASGGDFSFGLRDQADGTLHYATLPVVDHNEANAGLPGELDLAGDPWAALDSLAGQVKAAGIDQVNDVAIDDRIFEAYQGWDGRGDRPDLVQREPRRCQRGARRGGR